MDIYGEFLKTTVNVDFKGVKIAMDPGNGAAYKIAPKLFEELGAEVYVINDKPDGININLNCGSTHPEEVQQLLREYGADIGLAFDGDADRLIAVDNECQIVDGDHILTICGTSLKKTRAA